MKAIGYMLVFGFYSCLEQYGFPRTMFYLLLLRYNLNYSKFHLIAQFCLFDKCIYLHKHHHTQDIEQFYHGKKDFSIFTHSQYLPTCEPLKTTDIFSIPIILSLRYYTNGVIQYITF